MSVNKEHAYKLRGMYSLHTKIKKITICLFTLYRRTVGAEVQLHPFLTLALGGDEWSIFRPGRSTLGEEPPIVIEQGAAESSLMFWSIELYAC